MSVDSRPIMRVARGPAAANAWPSAIRNCSDITLRPSASSGLISGPPGIPGTPFARHTVMLLAGAVRVTPSISGISGP